MGMLRTTHLPDPGTACLYVLLTAIFAVAALIPDVLLPLLGAAAAFGLVFAAWRHLIGFSVAWLLFAGTSLEMTLHDLIDPTAYGATIAAVKAAQLGLAALCALRYGPRWDADNPAWAYLLIFAIGLLHGLHPGLRAADSLRSLAGSVAPFAFCFCRTPRDWAGAIIRATRWIPLLSVVGGATLDIAGLRPLFVNSGGMRLVGLGHPAFLAGVCLAAVYACLIRLYRGGGRADLALLGVNFVILTLTGARAPLAYGVAVTTLALAFIPAPCLPARRRWLLLLGVAALLPALALLDPALSDIRVFNLLATDSTDLSGRDLLWPPFEHAADQSYWFGWGLGAGNFIIPPEGQVAKLLQTWAAHNEYLRMEVEGGQIGRGLLVASFVLWALRHTRRLPRAERRIMRLVFIAFAAHAFTDNVLISTPASVLFSFVAAVFAGETSATAAARPSGLPKDAALA
ncbi:MAG: O-antigen ligase family protein [Nevskiales bacterium]